LLPARSADPELIEAGRLLFARDCRFVAGAADTASLPPESLPEIAFLGRSNVGKSSLINALCGRRMLARTSDTPGRTRQINFFTLDHRLMLVDLPGYGHAEAPKREIAAWNALIRGYLRGRPNLRRLYLLIDSRHGFKPSDREMMALLDAAAVSYQIVLTKADKAPEAECTSIAARMAAELASHPAAHPRIIATSAATGQGIPELRAAMADFAI